MRIAATMGIITLVLGFLMGILGQFPIQGMETSSSDQLADVDDFSSEAVERVAHKFTFAYNWVIDDLISYIDDPDLQRAEQQQQAMLGYAHSLIPQFRDLADQLQGKLDDLTDKVPGVTNFSTD